MMTLTTSQVEASMAGNYTCKPYNSWGSSGTSTVIRVVVEEQEETEEEEVEQEYPVVPGLPRLVGAWVDVLEVEVGQQVRLECQAEGEPHPEVGCCVFSSYHQLHKVVWDKEGSGPVEGGQGVIVEDYGVEGNYSNGEALVIHDLKVHHLGMYR